MLTSHPVPPSVFIRGIHDAGNVMRNMTADLTGKPRPPRTPYPKAYSGMTARQYRASRRAYGRAMRAHKKNLRTVRPDPAKALAMQVALFAAAARSRGAK